MTASDHISKGKRGENIAARFLESKGYSILERNWRWSTLEIDLICRKDEFLIFVEVKYRENTRFGDPADFVDDRKMTNISIAAARYREESNTPGLVRFDVIGIRHDFGAHYKIRHLRDVYFAGWNE